MSETNENKRPFICVSSDGDEEEDDDVDVIDVASSDYISSEDRDDDVEEEESKTHVDGDDNDDDDEESLCNKVISLLKERRDLGVLSLKGCKAYLRQHGLRLSGTKTVFIQRIEEHWRIKDGNGEAIYPKSSFIINCTGDVCQGDVVLFTQKVYKKFDKVTRHGRFLGKRTVAGRVVSDRYGAALQQHTFTIEILWSKGTNKLPPLFPLLVKGRNLYKLKTFRQCWKNEAERLKVLAEKHKRGAEARFVRAMRRKKKTLSSSGGTKHQKHFHQTSSSHNTKPTEPEKGKCVVLGEVGHQQHAEFIDLRRETPLSTNINNERNARSRGSQIFKKQKNFHVVQSTRSPSLQSYMHHPIPYPWQIELHNQNVPFHFSGSGNVMGQSSTAMTRLPHFMHDNGMYLVPNSHYQGYNYNQHYYSHQAYYMDPNCDTQFTTSGHRSGVNYSSKS